jgi:hypothetical protein
MSSAAADAGGGKRIVPADAGSSKDLCFRCYYCK